MGWRGSVDGSDGETGKKTGIAVRGLTEAMDDAQVQDDEFLDRESRGKLERTGSAFLNGRYPVRKRSKIIVDFLPGSDGLDALLKARLGKIVIFTGSGISSSSGMSTFSQKGGLYDRAKSQLGISDGMRLFQWDFYQKRRREADSFFAELYLESTQAKPTPTHKGLALLVSQGRILRHYTLNVDGLASQVGIDVWHPHLNPAGKTVEMHGNINELICPKCTAKVPMTMALAKRMKSMQAIHCSNVACNDTEMRPRIMLYDDKQSEIIVAGSDDERLWDTMELDVASADTVLWVGLSFKQSASTEYFKKVRKMLVDVGRADHVQHYVVNPDDQTVFNIQSSLCNFVDVNIVEVLARADEVIPLLVQLEDSK